jgi:putative membrane protein
VINRELFPGIGLYYGVLAFNLGVTFWIGEVFMGLVGCFIFTPLTAALLVTLSRGATFSRDS